MQDHFSGRCTEMNEASYLVLLPSLTSLITVGLRLGSLRNSTPLGFVVYMLAGHPTRIARMTGQVGML